MAKILYTHKITEKLADLKELEKYHRYSHLFQRVRMLSLLKSGECSNISEAADALGYSWRQCPRWFASDLKEATKMGEIATIAGADEFLSERHGIEYAHTDGVGQLLRRHKIKEKTGRPRHEKADPEKQEAFKKTSPTPSAEAESAIRASR